MQHLACSREKHIHPGVMGRLFPLPKSSPTCPAGGVPGRLRGFTLKSGCFRLASRALAAAVLSAASIVHAQDLPSTGSDSDERIGELLKLIKRLEERVQQLENGAMGNDDFEMSIQTLVLGATTNGPQIVSSATEETALPPSQQRDGLNGQVRDANQPLTRDELNSAEFPASWPMFGTDMRMKVGGYIKSDFVVDFDGTLDPTQFLMRTIPVEGTPEYGGDSYFDVFAKETRLNFDIRRIIPGSAPLRGFVEGDFFSAGDQFRLRHGYITAGDFTIGQTWTTLSMLEAIPIMIDFAAGDALFGGRAAQVRYTTPLSDRWKLAVAAEELQFPGIENASNLPGRATSQWPLFAARADYQYDGGMVAFGGSVGQLHWDGGADGPSDSDMQLAVLMGGRHNLGDKAYATYHLSYSEGAGENIMAFTGTSANAVLDADGNLETFPAFAAVLGFGYEWSSSFTTMGSYAYGVLDTPDTRADLELERGGVGHLNLLWRPNANKYFSTGAEIMYGKTRVQSGATGDATRLQLMAKFEF